MSLKSISRAEFFYRGFIWLLLLEPLDYLFQYFNSTNPAVYDKIPYLAELGTATCILWYLLGMAWVSAPRCKRIGITPAGSLVWFAMGPNFLLGLLHIYIKEGRILKRPQVWNTCLAIAAIISGVIVGVLIYRNPLVGDDLMQRAGTVALYILLTVLPIVGGALMLFYGYHKEVEKNETIAEHQAGMHDFWLRLSILLVIMGITRLVIPINFGYSLLGCAYMTVGLCFFALRNNSKPRIAGIAVICLGILFLFLRTLCGVPPSLDALFTGFMVASGIRYIRLDNRIRAKNANA